MAENDRIEQYIRYSDRVCSLKRQSRHKDPAALECGQSLPERLRCFGVLPAEARNPDNRMAFVSSHI